MTKMHLSLNVRDVEKSAAFYTAFFGASVRKRRPKYANFDLDWPPLKLALQEAAGGAMASVDGPGPLSHLGMQVATPEEVQAMRERLIASAGIV